MGEVDLVAGDAAHKDAAWTLMGGRHLTRLATSRPFVKDTDMDVPTQGREAAERVVPDLEAMIASVFRRPPGAVLEGPQIGPAATAGRTRPTDGAGG